MYIPFSIAAEVTPKCLREFVIGIVLPLNVNFNSRISVFENNIISVLSGLRREMLLKSTSNLKQ